MFSLGELESVIPLVRQSVPPTPQYAWPLLKERFGAEVVVKHENHTPIGSFKVRGGIVFFDRLKRKRPDVRGIISATRGNHGQSLAFAGARAGVAVTIVVPRGNSTEKNAAMRSFGAELMNMAAILTRRGSTQYTSRRNGVSNLLRRSIATLSSASQRTRTNYSRRSAILTASTRRSDWDPESAV